MATTIIKGSSNDNQAEVDSTGHLYVTDAAGGTSGGPPPASILEVGGLSPTNTLVPLMFDSSGRLLVDAEVVLPSTITVVQPSGANLHVDVDNFPSVQAVSQSGTWNLNNITGTISLPAGAATSALQTTGNTFLSDINNKLPTLGQKTSAGSVPVVIASDQSAIPVTGTVVATGSPTGVTAPAFAFEVAGINPSGNLEGLLVDNSGALIVNSSGTSTVTGTVTSNVAGLTAFQTSQYSIGITAVQITPTPLANRSSISLTVEAAPNVAVYIGTDNTVSTSTGYPLYDGSTIQLDLTPAGNIWAITATATQTIAALEIA